MWRRKKFVIVALLAAVVLVGSIGGVVFAQAGSTDNTTASKTLIARVAGILGIEQQTLQDAVTQARTDMRSEALDNSLKSLVDQGKITQAQADQYKAWVKAKPDMSQSQQQLKDWMQARPGISPELKAWQDARPNMPMPGGFGRFGGRGFGGGMMGRGHGFGGGMMSRGGSF